ncbi:RagB/SusD family nutrient uptake outer membrane protein [Mariniphaga sediminis]|uniref:RagB/SusD family nutrient uptake outer membrane protein n=1 Tax=Mariniphaga sediminis TaxID=1628158 RepID=UPI003568D538
MKIKIKKYLLTGFLSVVIGFSMTFQSCSKYLDIDPYISDLFTLDTLFVKKEYTQEYLNNVYSYLVDNGSNIAWHQGMPYTLITDEGLCTYWKTWHNFNYFANGKITPENLNDFDRWDYFYEGIRKANTFITRVNECKEVSELKRSEWIGEATFLKACIYFELMLAWGPVPIMPDDPIDFDVSLKEMMVERNTWDECSDYVSSLLETAIQLLPSQVRDNTEIGRPTKYSAMAVLSRLSLYTASPLYNGQNQEFSNFMNDEGTPYLNPDFNSEKWAIAAANAKRLVDLKPYDLYTVPQMENTPYLPVPEHEQGDFPNGVGGIDPFHSYADMFNGECVLASSNREILFSRQSTSVNDCFRYSAPTMLGGWGSFDITQNLADAYYMIDGRTIDNASESYPHETGYTDNEVIFSGSKSSDGFTILSGTHKWYVNREMRFYATVAYNNSYYPSVTTPPDKIDQQDGKVAKFYRDSKSGKEFALSHGGADAEDYPMTGYLCRKFTHYEDSYISGGRQKNKYNIVYRMAEVYLNYVEAMNELDGSYTINEVTVSRDVAEMKRCFNLIRYRAGLPGITDTDLADKERMRELILRERQIEMAWENRRYFDLRRTKNAVKYENLPVLGCNINASSGEMDEYYKKVVVRERDYTYKVFSNRQTFFPIPKHETDKNPNLDQFPGY